jgi:hypothetical protein
MVSQWRHELQKPIEPSPRSEATSREGLRAQLDKLSADEVQTLLEKVLGKPPV